MAETQSGGVLVIYTGGTIGSKPRDPDPDSPQIVVEWAELERGTPELVALKSRGLRVECEAITPLDSCNVGPKEWQQIAGIIDKNYNDFDGFVILHGTDTMVYTASALSFMLRELAKPVILTGAQRSALVDVRNDASQNFITALLLACPAFSNIPLVPEVCIYFGGKLLRGNRTVKRDTAGYDAYESPNLPPLGEVGDRIVIHESRIRRVPEAGRRFNVRKSLDTNVTTVLVYPGIQETDLAKRQLDGLAARPSKREDKLKAAIVMAYGSGNIPTLWPEWLENFRQARNNGMVIAAVSQCKRGAVELGIYETSARLLELGFVAASDVTLEAAQCKLMVLLGDPDLSQEEVEETYQRALVGEQSSSVFLTKYQAVKAGSIKHEGQTASVRVPGRPLEGGWQPSHIEKALLRFRGAKLAFPGKPPILFSVYLNLDQAEDAGKDHPGYAGQFKKEPNVDADQIILFDVTRVLTALTKPGERASFTVFLDTEGAEFSWNSVELAIIQKEESA
ncbi:MAG: asparaginase [Pyrinomonadaceae bacterium]